MKTTATPMMLSKTAWVGGGLVGAFAGSAAKKDHRVLGSIGGLILGALVVGSIADKMIERYYTPKWQAARERELSMPPLWAAPSPG